MTPIGRLLNRASRASTAENILDSLVRHCFHERGETVRTDTADISALTSQQITTPISSWRIRNIPPSSYTYLVGSKSLLTQGFGWESNIERCRDEHTMRPRILDSTKTRPRSHSACWRHSSCHNRTQTVRSSDGIH